MGNNNEFTQNTNNNNFGDTSTNTLSNNNENYRKAFNPNAGADFGMKNSKLIEIDKNSFVSNNINNFNNARNAGGNQSQRNNTLSNNNNKNVKI
jgi:hypothetical protein